jgi:ribosomal protein S18 acetylase RimI-like enzyme
MTSHHEADAAIWVQRAALSLAHGWELIAKALGGRTTEWGGVSIADAASPNPFLNAVTPTRPLQPDEIDGLTARLEAFFLERADGGPWVLWSGWPTPDLSRLGYILWGHPPIMVRLPGGKAPAPPPELRIVEARDADELAAIERTFVEAYPALGVEHLLPGAIFPASLLGGPYRFWAGYVEREVVSVSAALVGDTHTDVFYVATQPQFRRRGYGEALTWRATLADPTLPAILEASDDGLPVYERMGYREVGRMSLWERPRDPAHPVYSPYAPPRSAPTS